MMNTVLTTKYIETDKCQYIEVPYEKSDFVMTIMIPKKDIPSRPFNNILPTMYMFNMWHFKHAKNAGINIKVNLFLPKFIYYTKINLNESFIIDFKWLTMCPDFNVCNLISDNNSGTPNIMHEVVIMVDEGETESCADTTACSKENTMELVKPFIADHPFFYTIYHKPTNITLFMGSYDGYFYLLSVKALNK